MNDIIYWFLSIYAEIYLYSLPFLFILFWFWISHIDRLHMRERFSRFGQRIRLLFLKYKYWCLIEKYLLIQLNGLSEITSGFTYGILHKKQIIKIVEVCEDSCQTELSGEIKPIIITNIKEIEVIKEIIKEIIIHNNLPNNNSYNDSENELLENNNSEDNLTDNDLDGDRLVEDNNLKYSSSYDNDLNDNDLDDNDLDDNNLHNNNSEDDNKINNNLIDDKINNNKIIKRKLVIKKIK